MRVGHPNSHSQTLERKPAPFLRAIVILSLFCFGFFGSRSALACQVCVTLPEASLADHLITADVVVLAAPAPGNPFKFVPKRQIIGAQTDLERTPDIPFLVDSRTRAAFRANPSMTVLMTFGTVTKDGAGRGVSRKWTRIFNLTPEREEFLNALWAEKNLWPGGKSASGARVAFFARYLSHKDQVLRDTALIEIDRVPYSSIQILRNTVAADNLLREFDSLGRLSFVPVAIRLLGLQHNDEKAKRIVRSRYPGSILRSSGYAYDWALAGIAVDGPTAVDAIGSALQAANVKQDHKESLIRALTDSGTVSPGLRDQIIPIFSRELAQDSQTAMEIAIAMRNWDETRLDAQLGKLLHMEDIDPVTQFIIQTKLSSKD